MATIQERVSQSGAKTYRVMVRLKGGPPQTATFRRKTDAKRWAEKTETDIREGRHFKGIEARRHTFGELVDRYIRDVLPSKPKSRAHQTQQLLWWKGHLGDYVLADITPALIAECRDKLSKETTVRGSARSPSTTVRYMAALSHAFSIAVREWEWLDDSPMRRVSKPREPRGRVRFLSDDERERLLRACKESANPYLYPIVVLAISTGMRKSEILNLTWDDVDLHRGLITIHETKNNERRGVPLVGAARELLTDFAKVRRIDTNLLFPGKAEQNPQNPMDIRTPWGTALKNAQISDFRFHDLRHTCASYLLMNGASIPELAAILGHKTLQMVKRYAHLSDAHTSRVVERMNNSVFGTTVGSK